MPTPTPPLLGLGVTELREIAQRLLDAAYDIETHPAALLEAQADHEAVPA